MTWQRKSSIALALALTTVAIFAGRYFFEQSNLYSAMLKNLDAYWKIAEAGTLKREAILVRDAKLRLEQRSLPEFNSTSDVETLIYFQIQQRSGETQKVRIYVVLRNTSWIDSAYINGPYSHVVQWWKEPPTSDQIRNSISSTVVQHFGGDVVLRPRQARMIYTDFTFPYPMTIDFTVSTSFTENRLDDRAEKFVKDSVLIRGADLNAAKVVP